MAERFDSLNEEHRAFIEAQQLFFVATAGEGEHVNVSPKGLDTLRILAPDRLRWLNLTGSGNESAAHVLENGRMTLMFCSFDKQPLILRIYGGATMLQPKDEGWCEALDTFGERTGARQIFELEVRAVQTSCGYGVPRYDCLGERPTLRKWCEKKEKEGLQEYWRERNSVSLDGRPTGIDEQ